MWVKICANTSLADTLAAVQAGADAVGFVFAPSPRQVTAAQARLIAQALPRGVERVGVFLPTNPQPTHSQPANPQPAKQDEIAAAVAEAGLDAVQLHGGVQMRFAERLLRALPDGTALIQTVAWQVGAPGAEQQVLAALAEVASAGLGRRVLVDAKLGGRSGGLGVAFEWARARSAFASQPGLELIVAGGLRPDNVAQAIRTLSPWGVDVASGVEAAPGRKDHAQVRMFVANARHGWEARHGERSDGD